MPSQVFGAVGGTAFSGSWPAGNYVRCVSSETLSSSYPASGSVGGTGAGKRYLELYALDFLPRSSSVAVDSFFGSTANTFTEGTGANTSYVRYGGQTLIYGVKSTAAGTINFNRNTGSSGSITDGHSGSWVGDLHSTVYYYCLPNAPTGLSATVNSATSISLSWSAPASISGNTATTGYLVRYSTDGGSSWNTDQTNLYSTSTSMTFTASSNTSYTFTVAAVNSVTAAVFGISTYLYSDAAVDTGPVSNQATASTGSSIAVPTLSADLPNGTRNVYYSGSVYASGATSISYNVTSSLSGLSVSSNGVDSVTVSGTPTSAGTLSFSVDASNANPTHATGSYSVTINNPPAAAWDGTSLTSSVVQGQYYGGSTNGIVVGFTNATSVSYTGTLPAGITAGSSYTSGTSAYLKFSGIPTTAGVYSNINLSAVGGNGNASAGPFTITVTEPVPVWSTGKPSLTSGAARVSVGYSDSIYATSATSYTLSSGALPTGLALTTETIGGKISAKVSGTPAVSTEGTYTFVITATNGGGSVASSTQTITVASPPTAQAYVFNNGVWEIKTLRIFNRNNTGNEWGAALVYVHNGSTWVLKTL